MYFVLLYIDVTWYSSSYKPAKHLFIDGSLLQAKYNNLKRNSERLQMEVMQSRLWQASAIDGELEEEDIEGR